MTKMDLYIACSLDGYIADLEGGVDWLFADQDYGFKEFFENVEVVVMSRLTWEKALSFGEGLPMFPAPFPRRKLRLEGCRAFDSGLVELSYVRSEATTEATK